MAHPLAEDGELQPYTWLLYRAIRAAGVVVEPLRLSRLIASPPDVLHLHWPEHVLRRARLRRYARGVALVTAVTIARRRGTRLVLTVHNLYPHDVAMSRFGRWFVRAVDRRADAALLLAAAGEAEVLAARPSLRSARLFHTRHGHFKEAYPPAPAQAPAREHLGLDPSARVVAFCGQVRPYKGVEDLLAAASTLHVEVIVAGPCADPDLRARLERMARDAPCVHLHLGRLPAADLAAAVAASDLVVLPYRRVFNSGSVLLSLSLDRPVLVPDTPTFRELGAEVGGGWVQRFAGDRLDRRSLAAALADLPAGRPDLDAYEWPAVAAATIDAYRSVARPRQELATCASSS